MSGAMRGDMAEVTRAEYCVVACAEAWRGGGEILASPMGLIPSVGARHHRIPRVVSDLGVFDFATPDHAMRLASLHPGVSVEQVREATGFDLVIPDKVPYTREPTAAELRLIREVLDPGSARAREVAA